MAAIINSSIPTQNFELIRNRVGAILMDELANQWVINNNYPKVTKVWVERFIPFESNVQLPTVNVCLAKVTPDTRTSVRTATEIILNIDVYTSAPSSVATGPGDQYAMVTMNKLGGMIMAILNCAGYRTLGFTTDKIITTTAIDHFRVMDKHAAADALSDVVGRIQFRIGSLESLLTVATPVPLELSTTKVLLEDSTYGFYYENDLTNP